MASSPLRDLLARFGVEVDTKELDHADHKLEHFIETLKKVGAALLGGELVKGVFEFAEHTSEIGEQIEKAAVKLGISTDAFQEIGFAAGQSGVGIEEFTASLSMLENKAGEALKGGDAAKNFDRLGIKIRDANGEVKGADTLFEEAADKISQMGSNAEKSAAATELFGRAGRQLLPVLNEGSAGIEELRKKAQELGGGFSEAAVHASKDYHDALERAQFVTLSLRGKIAQVLLPVLQKVVDAATWVGKKFLEMTKNSRIVESGLVVLGAALAAFAITSAVALAPVIAPFLLWAAILTGIWLLVDDIMVLFQGGKSVIGEWIDEAFGKGQSVAVVQSLRDLWKSTVEWFKDGYAVIQKIANAIGAVRKLDAKVSGAVADFVGGQLATQSSGEKSVTQKVVGGAATALDYFNSFSRAVDNGIWKAIGGNTVSAPSTPGGAAANVNRSQTTNVTINAPNADAQEVKRIFDREMERRNQSTAEDLMSIAEPAR